MIKKIVFILVFFSLLFSCGKKADPEYKAIKSNALINNVL